MAKKGDLEQDLRELDRLRDRGVITDEEYQQRRSALLAAGPAPVAVQQKRGGFLRSVGIGCAVLALAALALIVVLVVAVGGNDDDDTQATSRASGDVRVPLAVGSSGTIAPDGNPKKQAKVTILAIQDNARSTNQFQQPPAGKRYWAVQVEVENVGSEETGAFDWKLRDSKDNELDDTIVSAVGENLGVGSRLTPGGKRSGWVVFEVDADAAPKWLRADPNPFLKNDLYFEAQ